MKNIKSALQEKLEDWKRKCNASKDKFKLLTKMSLKMLIKLIEVGIPGDKEISDKVKLWNN